MRRIGPLLLALLCAFATPAYGQPLAPQEVEDVQRLLATALVVDSTLSSRAACYAENDQRLERRSHELQESSADLHRQEREISNELDVARTEANGFQRMHDELKGDVDGLDLEMLQVRRRVDMYQDALDRCKRDAWIFGFVCDIAGEIAGLNAEIRQLRAQANGLRTRLGSMRSQLDAARERRDRAEERLQANQTVLVDIELGLLTVEGEIARLKGALAEIRTVEHSHAAHRSELADSFREFGELDPQSDRRSVARRVRRELADLSAVLQQARALLDGNGLLLPSGERICAQ